MRRRHRPGLLLPVLQRQLIFNVVPVIVVLNAPPTIVALGATHPSVAANVMQLTVRLSARDTVVVIYV
jgi:hypothetical protein